MSLNFADNTKSDDVLRTNDVIDSVCYETDALKVLMKVRPTWGRDRIESQIFTNGITNKLVGFLHNSDRSDIVLVRVNGNKTELFLDRDREVKSFQILQKAGCAPSLYCVFSNGLCYQFVDGKVLDKEMVRSPAVYSLIAKEMAKMHKISVKGQHKIRCPAVFNLIKKFLHLIFSPEAPSGKSLDGYNGPLEDELRAEMSMLEKTLSVFDSPIVFCHNDLLLNNVLFDDKKNIVHFIDYEYADFNYQAYDIANHFCEFAGVDEVDYTLYPDRNLQFAWLRQYLQYFYGEEKEIGNSEVEKLYIVVNKFALVYLYLPTDYSMVISWVCSLIPLVNHFLMVYANLSHIYKVLFCLQASHFMWGMWALVQAKYSANDFNYTQYAKERLGEYFQRKDKFLCLA